MGVIFTEVDDPGTVVVDTSDTGFPVVEPGIVSVVLPVCPGVVVPGVGLLATVEDAVTTSPELVLDSFGGDVPSEVFVLVPEMVEVGVPVVPPTLPSVVDFPGADVDPVAMVVE